MASKRIVSFAALGLVVLAGAGLVAGVLQPKADPDQQAADAAALADMLTQNGYKVTNPNSNRTWNLSGRVEQCRIYILQEFNKCLPYGSSGIRVMYSVNLEEIRDIEGSAHILEGDRSFLHFKIKPQYWDHRETSVLIEQCDGEFWDRTTPGTMSYSVFSYKEKDVLDFLKSYKRRYCR